jgi:RNA polymerase sigma factor (sigma-70 family)
VVPNDPCNPIQSSDEEILRKKARKLVGQAGISLADLPDLEQELRYQLLKRLPVFDERRGPRRFFTAMIVGKKASNLLRSRRAQKRACRSTQSLQRFIPGGEDGPVEMAAAIGQHERDARLQRDSRAPLEQSELGMDLREVQQTLPSDLRQLVEDLKTSSVAEVARKRGIPRTTLNDRIRRIRERFVQANLQDYLRRTSSG